MSDYINQFRQAMEAAGLATPAQIHADGKLHRFSTNGKRGDDSGWYVLHADGIAAGAFGCWRSGLQSSWCAQSDHAMSDGERQAVRERLQAIQRQRDAEQAQAHAAAVSSAASMLACSEAVAHHPYLTAKGIKAHGVRTDGERLMIPMRDTAGMIHSMQTIGPNGDKRFLSGGRVNGCYFSIGKPDGRLIVCEGFATGASIHDCTGHAVAVAFNAGNLKAVAVALRAKYPALSITIAADDDDQTAGNPGMTKATAAALAVNGLLAVPVFPADRPDKATDFNDLHRLAGADAVRRYIEAARRPAIDNADAWPDPVPLPDALPKVEPFDADLLPEALRGWVMDIAHRMQCPPDFPAVGAVVALSSLIGARAVVQPKAKDDWQVVPNLWGLIVGRPGVMKSPALGESLKPLHRLQSQEFEQWQVAHDAWAIDAKLVELQGADNEKKAKGLAGKDPAAARALLEQSLILPQEPVARRYIVNDATVEKLGELMKANPWGVLSYRDELYGLLTGMDRQGQEGSRAFYLQAYDGNQGYIFDRIGRGEVHIPRVCLAMIGGIQPGRVQEYVRGAVAGGSADDGLLQRFALAVWPDVNSEFRHVDQWPDTPAKQAAWAIFERLAALQPANDTEPQVWRFDEAAQALFVEWRIPFEQELKRGELHPAMESHLAKYRKLIPALALIFALIDTPDKGGLIGETELMRALAWGDYLRSHANRLYSAAVMPETTGAATLLKKIRSGALGDEFTPRQAAQKCWSSLATPEAVRKAADVLADYDWLRKEVQQTGGRPSERYLVNPKALSRITREAA